MNWRCKHCGYECKTIKQARAHAKASPPVWNGTRGMFTTHGLERISA